jgi:site-specific DNA recombinase
MLENKPLRPSMRAVIYSRVSTDAQEKEGTSLDTQEEACIKFAQENSWDITERVRETASGHTLERPGLTKVRDLLRDGFIDVIVSFAIDRLTRHQNHMGILLDDIEAAGAKLCLVTEDFENTSMGRFILSARALIAEIEREKIAERTMRGKQQRAREGKIPQGTGKGFYGYTYNRETGKREINSGQARVVRRIYTEFLRGSSLMGIVNGLNDDDIPTLTGSSWHPLTVSRLLKNQAYKGLTIYRQTKVTKVRSGRNRTVKRKVEVRDSADWVEVKDATPPIIDEETYQAAQDILNDPERRKRMPNRMYDYALSGRMKCAKCGRAMVGQTLQRGKYPYYKCRRAYAGPKNDRCDTRYIRAKDLESSIKEHCARVLSDPSLILREVDHASLLTYDRVERSRTQIQKLETQRKRLIRLYQLGEIDDQYFESELQVLKNRIQNAEERLAEVPSNMLLPSKKDLELAASKVRDWIQHAEGEDLKLMADALQLEISMDNKQGKMSGVIPDYTGENSDADVCSMVIKLATHSL